MNDRQIHDVVRTGYAEVARQAGGQRGSDGAQEGSERAAEGSAAAASRIGSTEQDVTGPAATGNLGLGCGNPTALAGLRPGEVVVDLGSGAGFDALLSAEKLGAEGRFIGIDMTPEMLERARTNAVNAGHARTVEFREGLIENIPVASQSADVVISNCVINLSPDKAKVFQEAFRILKPGGRLAVSDILLTQPLPPEVSDLASTWIACIGGASTEGQYLSHIRDAGFEGIEFTRTPASSLLSADLPDPMMKAAIELLGKDRIDELSETVFSYSITARKP